MRIRIFTEAQQGASYEVLLAVARVAEDLGFDAFFVSDHYMAEGGHDGQPGPVDALITLAGIARETKTIRFGTLVSPVTFRLPGPVAIAVAQIDTMSGGRVELGLGAGWYETEHLAYGIPFPPLAERFERLEEQLKVITGLWRTPHSERFSFLGKYYSVVDSPALPKPVQLGGPPLIVGGRGKMRAPSLAAQFAVEYNVPFAPARQAARLFGRARMECERHDRDPRSLVLSVALTVCCWTNEVEMRHRLRAVGQHDATMRDIGLFGTPDQVVERILNYSAVGAERIYLQILDLKDVDHLRLLAAEVVPKVI